MFAMSTTDLQHKRFNTCHAAQAVTCQALVLVLLRLLGGIQLGDTAVLPLHTYVFTLITGLSLRPILLLAGL